MHHVWAQVLCQLVINLSSYCLLLSVTVCYHVWAQVLCQLVINLMTERFRVSHLLYPYQCFMCGL